MALMEERKLRVWGGEGAGLERNERGVEPWRKEVESESFLNLCNGGICRTDEGFRVANIF